jgi:drug/metabolite transporter (DMT)-like permease
MAKLPPQPSLTSPSPEAAPPAPYGRKPELLLVLVTMVWGATFLIIHTGLQSAGPYAFLALRFLTAVLVLAVMMPRILQGVTREEVRAGVLIGAVLWVSFAWQTIGLQTIESAKSAFLTALYVPAVPLLALFVLRQRPSLGAWIGIGLAFTGLMLLSAPKDLGLTMGFGEAVTILGAVATAAVILMTAHVAKGCNPRRLAVLQLATAAVLSLGAFSITQEAAPTWTPGFIACGAGLGLASAFIQVSINWAQKFVPAARATIIFTMEPVWAGMIGAVAGERFGLLGYVGAGLILIGVLASELRWPFARPARTAE